MTSVDSAIELRIDCRNELGETPVWCADASTLYWIDVIAPGRVFFWNTRTAAVDFWEFPELVTGIDLMGDGGFLVRGTCDIVRFTPSRIRRSDCLLYRMGPARADSMTDTVIARADSGSVPCPTICWQAQLALPPLRGTSGASATARRARSMRNWAVRMRFAGVPTTARFISPIPLTVGSMRTPSRKTLARSCSVDPSFTAARSAYRMGPPWTSRAISGTPAGVGVLIRISPAGRLDRSVRLPVSQPTACCFGDDDLRTLYITTARYGLSRERLAMEPLAGGVFSLRVDVAGLPLPAFGTSASAIHPCHAAAFP